MSFYFYEQTREMIMIALVTRVTQKSNFTFKVCCQLQCLQRGILLVFVTHIVTATLRIHMHGSQYSSMSL